MAIALNAGYNSPELAAVAQNIAQMFGPPSGQELAAYSTARANNQKSNIVAQLQGNPDYQGFDHQAILADLYDPNNSFRAVEMGDATTRRGQDVTAATSRANNFDDNRTDFLVSQFEARDPYHFQPAVPGDIAASFDIPALPAVVGAPKPRTETEVKGGALQAAIEAGLITPEQVADGYLGGNTPVKAIGAEGQPVYMTPGEAVRTSARPAPGDPLVSVGAGESAYDREVGSGLGKQYLSYQNDATTARSALASLEIMENAMADPNFYSGVGGEQIAALKRLAAAIGANSDGIVSMESFNAAASQAALANMGGSLGAGFSNADRDFVLRMVPNLGTTPEGNAELIRIHKAMAQRKLEIAQLADDYAQQNGGRLDAGFNQYAAEWAERQGPVIAPRRESAAGAPAAPEPAATHAPQPGDVLDGYLFLGGDPADQTNWQLAGGQ